MKRIYFIISAAGVQSTSTGYYRRRYRKPATLYISKVSFTNGDGMAVNKIWHTLEKEKAYKFSKYAAEKVAAYLKGPTWRLRDVNVEPVTVELKSGRLKGK